MSIVLYEIADPVVPFYGGKYFTDYSPISLQYDNFITHNYRLVMDSNRIWMKTGDDVWYIKIGIKT